MIHERNNWQTKLKLEVSALWKMLSREWEAADWEKIPAKDDGKHSPKIYKELLTLNNNNLKSTIF